MMPALASKTGQMSAFLSFRGGSRLRVVGTGPKRVPSKTISPSAMARARREVTVMMGTGDWSGALGRHFVALFVLLHEKVYEVNPALSSEECFCAAGMAKQLMERSFGGDPGALARFIGWTWEREQSREQWRRERRQDGGHVGYRLQFCARLIVDYKIAQRRVGAQP